jgi:hypothetical protein
VICKWCEANYELPRPSSTRTSCDNCTKFFKTAKGQKWLQQHWRKNGSTARKLAKQDPNSSSTYNLRKHHEQKQEGVCAHCKRHDLSPLQLDHVLRIADGGKDTIVNTWLICKDCHQIKTSAEGYRSRFKGYMSCPQLKQHTACADGLLRTHGEVANLSMDWLHRGSSQIPVFHFTKSNQRIIAGCARAALQLKRKKTGKEIEP